MLQALEKLTLFLHYDKVAALSVWISATTAKDNNPSNVSCNFCLQTWRSTCCNPFFSVKLVPPLKSRGEDTPVASSRELEGGLMQRTYFCQELLWKSRTETSNTTECGRALLSLLGKASGASRYFTALKTSTVEAAYVDRRWSYDCCTDLTSLSGPEPLMAIVV